LPGVTLPPVHVLRRGDLAWVDTGRSSRLHSWSAVVACLADIGEALVRLLPAGADADAQRQAWATR